MGNSRRKGEEEGDYCKELNGLQAIKDEVERGSCGNPEFSSNINLN